MESKTLTCSICDMNFNYKKNLYVHARKKHNVELLVTPTSTTTELCHFCGKMFSKETYLKRHLIKMHPSDNNLESKARNFTIVCSQCQHGPFPSYSLLRKHLNNTHNENLECENHVFNSIAEFEEWKSNVESATHSKFVKDCSTKYGQIGHKTYYYCHRSNNFHRKGNNKRLIKKIGTNKVGKVCPSTVELVFVKDKYHVKHWTKHFGHNTEIGRMTLNKEERAKFADCLSRGVPIQRILNDVRTTASSEPFKRVHLLKRKDLHNIRRDFHIDYAAKCHENDAISVKLWIEKMKIEGKCDSVLFYKEQGVVDPHRKLELVEPMNQSDSDNNADITAKCSVIIDMVNHKQISVNKKMRIMEGLNKVISLLHGNSNINNFNSNTSEKMNRKQKLQ